MLVNQLRKKGIRNTQVLDVMNVIPRHLFMESGFVGFAYQDQAFPISAGQTISQPYTVAFQTELLDPQERQKVLEVGTGSGYQTAVLVELGMRVFTVERIKTLYQTSSALLRNLDFGSQCFYGDGYAGLPTYGPFDKILITAGAPEIPEALKSQLKIGGVLVAPIGPQSNQVMTRCERVSEKEFIETYHGNFVFVPMLKGRSDSE